MKKPGETTRAQAGPGFDQAVRACLSSGVILVAGGKNIATLTPEAAEMLGVPKEKGPEQPLDNLPPGIVQVATNVLKSGKPAAEQQLLLDSVGTRETIYINALPIKPGGDSGAMAVLTLHKVSASGEFLQRIRQLDRLANAGTLAAGMAHEIRNALVAGRTFLDLLLEKNSDEDLVQIVRRETGRIDAIVGRMLRFAGTSTGTFSALHVHEVLEQALRLIQPQLGDKSFALEQSCRAGKDTIRGDEFELHQAFVNLLLNALEAMGSGGRLTVATEERPENQIEIRIGDTGPGIAPEHMPHVFEPFFTTKSSGTGLGLAVTQRIIQEHSGAISVDSRPGQGTTFSILLPLLKEHEPAG